MTKLSVIIPVLNEAEFLTQQSNRLESFIKEKHEVIVVDGGSKDNSASIASKAGFSVFVTNASRGHQLRIGVEKSQNEILVFLHADTELPLHATSLICNALAPTHNHWGRFSISFTSSKLIFQLIAWFMNKRSCLTGIVTGDHAMFMERDYYFKCGGFPDCTIMEDIVISKRLKKASRPVCLSEKVKTSCRKWERQGVYKTIIKMWNLRILFLMGVSTEKIAKLY